MQTIKSLIALMSRHDLAEIDLHNGDQRIRLRRGTGSGNVLASPPLAHSAPVAVPVPLTAATPAPPPEAPAVEKPAKNQHLIKSPTPGTFYTAASPGAEPFVRVGTRVTPSSVVGLIEAMKLFNEITADCTGVISEVLVENQQPVEFGQPLFKVDLSADGEVKVGKRTGDGMTG